MSTQRCLLVAMLLLVGCGSGAAPTASGPVTSTRAKAGATVSTTASTSISSTAITGTAVTEPPVGPAQLKEILLTPADLPQGFVAAPASDTGAEITSLMPCGHSITASGPSVASARAVFGNTARKQRLVQQVLGFNGGDPGALLAQIRQVRDSCRKSGSLTVAPIDPPAVGEQVAGVQLSGGGQVIDVVIVRTPPINVLLILTGIGGTIPAASLNAVVAAAGTRLAVGTGG